MKNLKTKRMKKSLFIVFFAVQTIFIQAQSDTTYTGNITVTTQAEVDTLSTTLAGKTRMDGNLTIGYTDFGDSRSDITDLSPLSNMSNITGNLIIQQNGQLVNLNPLTNLQSIGGSFNVDYNDQLTDLGYFPALQTIGGYFSVFNNDQLATLGNLPELQFIGGYFDVIFNDKLLSLGSFPNLTSIGISTFSVYVPSLDESRDSVSIVVESNSNLVLCSWLESFLPDGNHAVTGDIYIQDNAMGCETTEEIKNPPPVLVVENHLFTHKDSTTTFFNIYANVRWQLATSDDATWITSLSSDSSTHTSRITGENEATITLTHTRAPDETPRSTTLTLTAINEDGDELMNLATVTINFSQLSTFYEGDIILSSQEEVDEFISNTALIDGNLTIGYTDYGDSRSNITDLTPLSNMTHITGNLRIQQNGQLDNINDLNNLQSIGGYFNVNNNDQLTTLGDFSALQTVGEYFAVWQNSNLSSLGDFPVLQSIGGYFNVDNSNKLTSLGNFSSLQFIGGYFDVIFNDKLLSLGSFPNLTSIGISTFSVYVPSLDESRDSVSIVVESNSNLVLCSWLESFLPDGNHAVTGDIYIQDNAMGCETTEEIKNPPPVLVVENHLFTHKDSTTTFFNIYANVRWQLATSDDATWITSLSSDSSTHTSRITGENEATITLTHTRAPDETPRSTTLTLTAINEDGDELMNLATVTINFSQLSTFYEGDIILSSQEEVDEFISNTALIDGNLTIGYTDYGDSRSNITDLTPLSNMTHITGNLRIQQNGQLDNINDLNNLQSIGGYFNVNNNDQLTTLGDFSALQTVGEYFAVWQNSNLSSLGDFLVLQSIGENFNVNNNTELTTLGAFSDLQSVGGVFSVWQNSNLSSLGDFPALQSIGEFFNVQSNDRLLAPGNFPVLQSIGGYFNVDNSNKLTSLGDFSNLQSIEKYFEVSNNAELTSLGNFSSLQFIGEYFEISNHAELTSLGNFSSLQSIGEYFEISNNPELTSLGNFSSLQSIGGYFRVNNNQLTTLENFPDLQTIGEYFRVHDNDKLASLGSFPNLTSIGIGETYVPSLDERRDTVSIVVENNNNLVLCTVLEKFLSTGANAVTGGIYVQNNATGCETSEEINNSPPVLVAKNRIFTHKDSTTTSFNIYANVRWKLVTSDDATWITSLSSGSSIHSSRITGENEATITLIHTRAPNETPRSTTLTLTAIDENGEELTNPATVIIHFSQLTLYEGNITLTSQTEVNEFISNTTVILGNLTIGYTDGSSRSDITDLTPLSNMTHITGNLIIQQNEQLNNINDLNNLQTIGGYFRVKNNNTLTTLGDFPDLQTIGKYFEVINNEILDTIGIFSTLQIIGEFFWIINNDRLITLGNFPALQTIGEYFSVNGNDQLTTLEVFPSLQTIEEYFSVSNNDTLTTLGDFPSLQTIGGYFRVNFNDQLTTLGDFPALQTIGKYFEIISNNTLTTLRAFSVLQTVGGDFNVSNNDQLTTSGDFPDLQTIGGYFGVYSNDQLTILGDFPALQTIGGYFRVTDNDQLTTLGGFPALQTIGGYFRVGSNDTLTTLGDFSVLQSIEGYFWVRNNDILTTLGNFSILQTIGGYFRVRNNDILTTLGDFLDLQTIGGYFRTSNNNQLTTLGDFPALQTIGGYFTVNNNDTLTTLGNFPVLDSIGESFLVYENDQLTTLGDFSNLINIGVRNNISIPSLDERRDTVSIVVEHNPRLSDCCVLARFLNQENTRVEGNIFITENAIGCDRDTIQNTCHTIIVTTNKNHQIAYDNIDTLSIGFTVGGVATGWTSTITYAPADANFITLDTNMNDNQTGAITLMATPTENTGVERTATITLTSTGTGAPVTQMIVITQQSPPTIMLSTSNQTIAYNSTDPIDISFTVGGSAAGWTSAITYTPANANFITLSPTEGIDQTGAITLMATPTVNTGVERTATITLTSTGTGAPVTQMIVITQQSPPTIMLSTSDQTIAHNSIDPIDISFTVGGSAAGWTSTITYTPADANFITLDTNMNDNRTGAITLMATPTENMGVDRIAMITLTTTGMGTSDSVSLTITQRAKTDTTTLSTHTKESLFTLYPNPTNGNLTVEGVTRHLQMYVHDLVGREVMTYSLTPSNKTIDVSNLPSGMYVVTLQGEDKTWTEVLIIVN